MTAETLKPFITPTNDNFPATHHNNTTTSTSSTASSSSAAARRRQQQRSAGIQLLPIVLSVCACLAVALLLGFTIWNALRVKRMEGELQTLQHVVERMRERLGLQHLEGSDDLNEFEREYAKIFDEPAKEDYVEEPEEARQAADDDDDEDEDDDDDDEDDEEQYDTNDNLDEWIKKYYNYEDTSDENEENRNVSDDDNLYDDFEKFKDAKSKNKHQQSPRKSRSIAPAPNELTAGQMNKTTTTTTTSTESLMEGSASTPLPPPRHRGGHSSHKRPREDAAQFVAPPRVSETRHSLLRGRRRRKYPIMRSGESLISAKSAALVMHAPTAAPLKPAAHFHLNRKVPDRHAAIKVDSYTGDMYIGQASWSNERPGEAHFYVDNGVLTVREPGLYYIYAQVCYNNTHDQNGFVIFHGERPFLQCLNTVPTNLPLKIHTCHTSGLIELRENESIHLRDFHADRNAILKDANNRSYFGLIKI